MLSPLLWAGPILSSSEKSFYLSSKPTEAEVAPAEGTAGCTQYELVNESLQVEIYLKALAVFILNCTSECTSETKRLSFEMVVLFSAMSTSLHDPASMEPIRPFLVRLGSSYNLSLEGSGGKPNDLSK